MSLPIYRVVPRPGPDGKPDGWVFTKSQQWRWSSVRRRIKDIYPSPFRAMDAAFEKPDVVTRRQVCWITKVPLDNPPQSGV